MSKNLKGSLMLLVAALIWGTAFVAQSVGMDYIGPFTFNGVRTLVGGIVLLPVIFFIDRSRRKNGVVTEETSNKKYIPGGIVCGLVLFGASSLQQVGIQYTTAGKAGFLTALYIVIVPIIGIFIGRKAGLKVWVSVLIALAGTYLLSVQEGFSIGVGDTYCILCAVVFSFHILAVDKFAPITDAVKLSCVQFFTAGSISLVVALITENPQIADILRAWLPILYCGIMSSGVAYTLQIVGQRDTQPAVASIIMSLESVFSALAGWVILSEQLAPKELFGCVLVFAAVIITQLPSLKKKENGLSS